MIELFEGRDHILSILFPLCPVKKILNKSFLRVMRNLGEGIAVPWAYQRMHCILQILLFNNNKTVKGRIISPTLQMIKLMLCSIKPVPNAMPLEVIGSQRGGVRSDWVWVYGATSSAGILKHLSWLIDKYQNLTRSWSHLSDDITSHGPIYYFINLYQLNFQTSTEHLKRFSRWRGVPHRPWILSVVYILFISSCLPGSEQFR